MAKRHGKRKRKYVFTAARRRALKKAQATLRKKRHGKRKKGHGRKRKKGHGPKRRSRKAGRKRGHGRRRRHGRRVKRSVAAAMVASMRAGSYPQPPRAAREAAAASHRAAYLAGLRAKFAGRRQGSYATSGI